MEIEGDSSGGKPELASFKNPYSLRRTAFLDILGFKDIVERSVSDRKLLKKLNAMLHSNPGQKALLEFSDFLPAPDGRPISQRDYRISSFSDSIVVSAPSTEDPTYFLLFLCHFSCFHFEQRFLFRGAALVHHLVHQDDLVFGPSLQRAYELEAEHAIYPRILLQNGELKYESEVCILTNPWQRPEELVAFQLVKTDLRDGLQYLNSAGFALAMASIEHAMNRALKHGGGYDPRTNKVYWQRWPKRVKTIVEKSLALNIKTPEIHMKYDWYARYFNEAYFENAVSVLGSPDRKVRTNPGLGRRFGIPIEVGE